MKSTLNAENRKLDNKPESYSSDVEQDRKRTKGMIILAFIAIYVIWGSTYLGIHYALESFPPFLMGAIRFLIAGSLVLTYNFFRGGPKPTTIQLRNAATVGCLLLVCGNGTVCWAEQRIPSGVTALLIAMLPMWLLLINWVAYAKVRPTGTQVAGVCLGISGLALLLLRAGGESVLGKGIDAIGAVVVLFGNLGWAFGTMIGRTAELPKSPVLSNGVQMLGGGIGLSIVAGVRGEFGQMHPLTTAAFWSFSYLVVFGSIVALSAYAFLNGQVSPARLGTYAYVNPVVAMVLGALFGAEGITLRSILAMVLILCAVVLLSIQKKVAAEGKEIPPPTRESDSPPPRRAAVEEY